MSLSPGTYTAVFTTWPGPTPYNITFTFTYGVASSSPTTSSSPSTQPEASPTPTKVTESAGARTTSLARIRPGHMVGAVIGGLVVGAIIMAALLFFLYRRRNRFRNNVNTVYVQDNAWQNERKQLVDKLNVVEADRARFRTVLQINDAQDSRDIVEAFQRLNVSIRNISLTTANAILKSVARSSSRKTYNPSNLAQLQLDLAGATGLISSDMNIPRPPKDFLAEAFRFVINSTLEGALFQRFHPFVSPSESDLLRHSYQQIRNRDEQRISARWRCSTYTAIDDRYPATTEQEWAKGLADNLQQQFSSIANSVFGDEAKDALPKNLHDGLSAIGKEAFGWNKATKTTYMSLDFQPVVFTGVDHFDPDRMALYQNHTPKESPPRSIICGVSMGLMSTAAVVSGDVVRQEADCQVKAEVLTEGFF